MQIEVDFINNRIVERDKIETAVSTLADGRYLIQFDKLPMKHSDAQRKYLNGIVVKYFQNFWRDVHGHMHEKIVKGHLKAEFLKKEHICRESGEVMEYVLNTSDLNMSEMDNFIQQCRMLYLHQSGEEIPYVPYYRGPEQ